MNICFTVTQDKRIIVIAFNLSIALCYLYSVLINEITILGEITYEFIFNDAKHIQILYFMFTKKL